jgi:hypothetical protein
MGTRMNTQVENPGGDWIERALAEAGREHRAEYIADDGFTASVVSRLPAPFALPAWRRPVVALLWILGGLAVLVSLPGLFDQVFRGVMAMLLGHRMALADIAMALILLGGVTGSALVYAARTE